MKTIINIKDLTTKQFFASLVREKFDSEEAPERRGAIIDKAIAVGLTEVAADMIIDWKYDSNGKDMYAAYKRGDFDFTDEYKAVIAQSPTPQRGLSDDEQPEPVKKLNYPASKAIAELKEAQAATFNKLLNKRQA